MTFQLCRNSANKDLCLAYALLQRVPLLFASPYGGGGSNAGGGTPPSNSTITSVSCIPTSVQTGQTSQCSATVSGTGSYSSIMTQWTGSGTAFNSGLHLTQRTDQEKNGCVCSDHIGTAMKIRNIRNVAVAIASISLSVPLSLTAQEEPTSTSYTCEASTAALPPPQASPPSLQAVGNNQHAVVDNQQNYSAAKNLTSVCPEGKVPVAVFQDTRYFHKGNPRLGSYPAYGPEHDLPSEFIKKYLLRSFEEVYGKGDSNPTEPISHSAIAPSAPAAATPTFSVPAGTYTNAPILTISDTTPLATIYYTTNGTAPTTSSTVYSGPVTVSSSETLEAIATASGVSAGRADKKQRRPERIQ